jgi:hypothetical protein
MAADIQGYASDIVDQIIVADDPYDCQSRSSRAIVARPFGQDTLFEATNYLADAG